MKVRIEIDENIEEDEVTIRCRELTPDIAKIQQAVQEMSKQYSLTFYKDNAEFYIPLSSVLFFETSGKGIDAHTSDDMFTIRNKLYELEELLPKDFIRVSKSTILNVSHIYSIEKNITSSSLVKFKNSHKQVFVSRNYFKVLKQRMDERRTFGR